MIEDLQCRLYPRGDVVIFRAVECLSVVSKRAPIWAYLLGIHCAIATIFCQSIFFLKFALAKNHAQWVIKNTASL